MAPFWTLYPISGKSNKIRSFLGSWFHSNKWYLVAVYTASISPLALNISHHALPAVIGIAFKVATVVLVLLFEKKVQAWFPYDDKASQKIETEICDDDSTILADSPWDF